MQVSAPLPRLLDRRVASKGRRPVVSDPLRELRHKDARAAREVTLWLLALASARKSPRTVSEYGRLADGLLARYPSTALDAFTPDDLALYIGTHPEASRPVVKSALSSLFRWAYRQGRIPRNPVELLDEIKAPEQRLVTIFSDPEAEALCALPLPDGVLMRVLFSTGIRRAEASSLQVKHVNFEARHVEILRGKGNHDRLVSLTPTLAGKLDHWFTTDGMGRDDFLWYSRPGGHWREHSRRIAPSTFQRWWTQCLHDAGIEYRNPHSTRHTFATRSIRAGVDVDKVRRALGHKNIATTVQTYVHMNVEDMHDDFALVELS